MTDHPDQYKVLFIRTPAHIYDTIKKLAHKSGTDITGYMNAVVLTNHIKENDKSIIANGAQSGQPGER